MQPQWVQHLYVNYSVTPIASDAIHYQIVLPYPLYPQQALDCGVLLC